jgi:hypothetical protein
MDRSSAMDKTPFWFGKSFQFCWMSTLSAYLRYFVTYLKKFESRSKRVY